VGRGEGFENCGDKSKDGIHHLNLTDIDVTHVTDILLGEVKMSYTHKSSFVKMTFERWFHTTLDRESETESRSVSFLFRPLERFRSNRRREVSDERCLHASPGLVGLELVAGPSHGGPFTIGGGHLSVGHHLGGCGTCGHHLACGYELSHGEGHRHAVHA